ncbi:MAG TPA: DUF1572 family protein [Flavisolibacter sp.]|jgi:hypothetical protein
MNVEQAFLESAIKRFRDYKELAEKTFGQLGDADMHVQPNEASNSIAIIIRHMHGNMLSRWTNFLTEDGEKPWRRRDEEFEASQHTKEQLLELWNEGWKVFFAALESLKAEDLLSTITINSKPFIVIDAINGQMAHYSYHVGQIVYLGRWLRNSGWKSLSIPKAQPRQDVEQSRH